MSSIAQTIEFLNALEGFITFQTFDDTPAKKSQLACILHGNLEKNLAVLTHLNKLGAGIFFMVNQGDGKGRKKENVKRIRALFADFDGTALPEKWVLEPSIIVESSSNKYHIYWLLSDTLPLDDFKPLQKVIAEVLGSDEKVCDLPRVMRLPSFYHCKGEPFLTRLVKCDSNLRYTASQLRDIFPVKEVKPHKPNPVTFANGTSDNAKRYAQKVLENEYNLVTSAPKGNRNNTLVKAAYSLGQLIGSDLLDVLEVKNSLLNAGLICGLSQSEIQTTLNSGLKAGALNPRYPKPLENDYSNPLEPTNKRYKTYSQRRYARLRGWT